MFVSINTCLPVYLLISLSVCLFNSLSLYLSLFVILLNIHFYLSVCLSTCLSFVCLSVCLLIYMYILNKSVCLSVPVESEMTTCGNCCRRWSVCVSFRVFVCQSVYLFIFHCLLSIQLKTSVCLYL